LWYRLIEDRRAERRAYADSLKTKFSKVQIGTAKIDLELLDVERRLALALTKEYQAIAEYNNSLARLEFARGTIMQRDNVVIAENGLTPCAQVRAVEHEQQRTKAFVLRQHPDPVTQPAMVAADATLPNVLKVTTAPAEPGAAVENTPLSRADDAPPQLFPEPAFKSDAARPTTSPQADKDSPAGVETELPAPAAEPSPLPPPPLGKLPGNAPAAPDVPAASPQAPTPQTPATPAPVPEPGLPPPPPIPDVINEGTAPSSPPASEPPRLP
jgi:hypothetical protein